MEKIIDTVREAFETATSALRFIGSIEDCREILDTGAGFDDELEHIAFTLAVLDRVLDDQGAVAADILGAASVNWSWKAQTVVMVAAFAAPGASL